MKGLKKIEENMKNNSPKDETDFEAARKLMDEIEKETSKTITMESNSTKIKQEIESPEIKAQLENKEVLDIDSPKVKSNNRLSLKNNSGV